MQSHADNLIPVKENEVSPQPKSNPTSLEVLEAIEKLVEGAFSMDTLGIKDKVRSAGVSKFYKKDISDWSPKEKEIDDKIIVTLVPMTNKTPQHYTAKVPWKNVFLSFCLSVFLSFCLSVFLSFCLSVFLSFCLSVFLSFHEERSKEVKKYPDNPMGQTLDSFLFIILSAFSRKERQKDRKTERQKDRKTERQKKERKKKRK
jgi:hypothetical protein